MARIDSTIVDGLYATFSVEPKPSAIPTAFDGLTRDEINVLLARPLRQLDMDDILPYISGVFASCGSERDFKYFAPRIMELLPDTWMSSWPQYFGRAIYALKWNHLIYCQQEAITVYFTAAIEELIGRTRKSGGELDAWICCTSYFLPAWNHLLERINSSSDAVTAIIKWHIDDFRKGRLANAYWEESPQRLSFERWIESASAQDSISPHLRLYREID